MEELKNLRLEIDGIYQLTNDLNVQSKKNDNFISEPIKSTCQSLLMAKAWCGKLMGYLGGETPYKNDGNRKEVSDIEATDAVKKLESLEAFKSQLNYIEKVDSLREIIEEQVKVLINLQLPQGASREANISRTTAFINLSEARIHLGFEMERLRGGRKS